MRVLAVRSLGALQRRICLCTYVWHRHRHCGRLTQVAHGLDVRMRHVRNVRMLRFMHGLCLRFRGDSAVPLPTV